MGNTWRRSLSLTFFLSSSLVLLEERKMVLITLILTHPVFTLSQRKYGMHTNNLVRLRTLCSPVLLPSETYTEYTHQETLTFSQRSFTTPKNTSRRSLELMRTSQ